RVVGGWEGKTQARKVPGAEYRRKYDRGAQSCGFDCAGETMYFEQFYLGCLAHASYILGSEGEAVVVDPQRDVDIYLKAAGEHGLKIRHIFETHLHADFVS